MSPVIAVPKGRYAPDWIRPFPTLNEYQDNPWGWPSEARPPLRTRVS